METANQPLNGDIIRRVAESWIARNPIPTRISTNWGESLLMYGIFTAARTLADKKMERYVEDWIVFHLIEGIPANYYCGSWGTGLLFPELATEIPRLALDRHAEYLFTLIRDKAIRNGNGVILHNIDLPDIFADTVYYSAAVIAKLGVYLKREWTNEAMLQLFAHAAVLQDKQSFLFIHAEENLTGNRSEGYWARGNGWIAMTCAEIAPLLPHGYEYRAKFESFYKQLSIAVKQKQSASGMWRTLMDDATAYEETSASAMFLFSLRRGVRIGLLDDDIYDETITNAAAALARQVNKKGVVIGVSGGTLPSKASVYKDLPTGEFTWGTGAWLLAASEMMR